MDWLHLLRWAHIIGAAVLLGTGAGIAFLAASDDSVVERVLAGPMPAAVPGSYVTPAVVRAAWEAPSGDAAAGHAPGVWARLAEAGVLGMAVPEELGGLGLGRLRVEAPPQVLEPGVAHQAPAGLEDHHPHRLALVGPGEGHAQFLPHRLVDGIRPLGPIESNLGNALVQHDEHGCQLGNISAQAALLEVIVRRRLWFVA